MDTVLGSWELAAFALGFLTVGVGSGLVVYHFSVGWFISRMSKEEVDRVVGDAERHSTRRAERRHGRERRRRILGEAEVAPGVSGGRHLAR